MKRLALGLLFLATASCSSAVETSLRISVAYDSALAVDELRIQLSQGDGGPRLVEGRIFSGIRVLLLVPDAWSDTSVDVTVSGLAAGKEIARGHVSGAPRLGAVVDLAVALTGTCLGTCVPGETRCESGQIRWCEADRQGCGKLSAPEACPVDKPVCSGDRCAASCSDACASGQRRCASGGYQVCGNVGGCLDWGPVQLCGTGLTCRPSDGQCAGCTVQPSCTGKACGADDGCGGTCQTGSCPTNHTCQGGACVCGGVSCGPACCAAGESCVSSGTCGKAPLDAIMVVALGQTSNGSLGGLQGADASCQAAAGGLSGTWKALLCSDGTAGSQRVLATLFTGAAAQRPVVNSNGQVLYGSWSAMFGCNGSDSPAWTSGVSLRTAAGQGWAGGNAWTGCNCDGHATSATCADSSTYASWSSTKDVGVVASWYDRQLISSHGAPLTCADLPHPIACVRVAP